MKDYLASLVAGKDALAARNIAREYLQARVLESMHRVGAMSTLAFHGGTALRFLYAIARYSEDLDFALESNVAAYDFRRYLRGIQGELSREAYQVSVKVNDRKTVHGAFVQFTGLLFELGNSPHRTENLSIKVEVDTQPPSGAVLATTVIRRYVTLQLQHHDPATLLAGKLHAVLQRPYAKGRDLYDLLWYLSDPNWPPPNFNMLNSALLQSGWIGARIDASNWTEIVQQRLNVLDWTKIAPDVRPFLEQSDAASLLTKENLARLLAARAHSGRGDADGKYT
jgi:predicted nucleotidyltransferase component of viral defense system